MAEWYENESTVRRVSGIMAREFKAIGVDVSEGTRAGMSAVEEFGEKTSNSSGLLDKFGTAMKLATSSTYLMKTALDKTVGPAFLKWADMYGSAMANAVDQIRDSADIILNRTNNEDGTAEFLELVFKNRKS